MKQPGIIYKLQSGEYGLMLYDDQKPVRLKNTRRNGRPYARNVRLKIYLDRECTVAKTVKGIQVMRNESTEGLTQITITDYEEAPSNI